MTELSVLRAVRLKGRVRAAGVAATLGADPDEIADRVAQLVASGLLVEGTELRITQAGRARLEILLAKEREGVDTASVAVAYDQFRSVNDEFKALVTDWQLKGGPHGSPNAHDDAGYDAAVLGRLDAVHARAIPIIDAAGAQLPRLTAYSTKLIAAHEKIQSGDTAWLTKPLVDSYHTVWFELHEELIGAVGLTRQEAARSGDAQ